MANYFIVGASSGIGQQLAEQLIAAGHCVWGTYLNHALVSENNKLTYQQLNVLDDALKLDFLPDELAGLIYCPGSINLTCRWWLFDLEIST